MYISKYIFIHIYIYTYLYVCFDIFIINIFVCGTTLNL